MVDNMLSEWSRIIGERIIYKVWVIESYDCRIMMSFVTLILCLK